MKETIDNDTGEHCHKAQVEDDHAAGNRCPASTMYPAEKAACGVCNNQDKQSVEPERGKNQSLSRSHRQEYCCNKDHNKNQDHENQGEQLGTKKLEYFLQHLQIAIPLSVRLLNP